MFKFLTTADQLLRERRKNEVLRAELDQTSSDVAYIAMMTDVELENDTEETGAEDNVSEV